VKPPAEPAAEPATADDVPRLPRGRGLRLSGPQLVRIAGTVCLLVFLIVVQRPCANAVSTFVTSFGSSGDRGSAAATMPRPGTDDVSQGSAGSAGAAGSGAAGSQGPSLDQYERLRPGMTDDEIKAVIDRARRRAAGGSAAP
jgi:hypothetical protein